VRQWVFLVQFFHYGRPSGWQHMRNLARAQRRARMWEQHAGNQAVIRCLGVEIRLLRCQCLLRCNAHSPVAPANTLFIHVAS